MRVLVGHERFGRVRDAFRRRGHDAWSCDLAPDASGSPFHIQDNVLNRLNDGWDLAIFFPDCTFLTVSAAWAFNDGPYHQKIKSGTLVGRARREARADAIAHVETLMKCNIPRVGVENPGRSFLATMSWVGKPHQIIHPHWFGEDAEKATGLWLRELPLLIPTKMVPPRWINGLPRWANQTDNGQNRLSPSDDRAMRRAITYDGIANAMAQQWE